MASIMRIVVVTFSKIFSRLWNRLWNLGREFIHNNFPDELEGQLNLVIWNTGIRATEAIIQPHTSETSMISLSSFIGSNSNLV